MESSCARPNSAQEYNSTIGKFVVKYILSLNCRYVLFSIFTLFFGPRSEIVSFPSISEILRLDPNGDKFCKSIKNSTYKAKIKNNNWKWSLNFLNL